jgi:hypothetical protein
MGRVTLNTDRVYPIDYMFQKVEKLTDLLENELIETNGKVDEVTASLAESASKLRIDPFKYVQNMARSAYYTTDPIGPSSNTNFNNYAGFHRRTLMMGDSHSWGEGSPNYQGIADGYSVHSPWVHNDGYMDRLRKFIMAKMNSEPWRCIPRFDAENIPTYSTATYNYGSLKATSFVDKETFTQTPKVLKGRYINYKYTVDDEATQLGKDNLKMYGNAKTKADTYADTEYKYNADVGLLGSGMIELGTDIDRITDEYYHVTGWKSMPSTAGWTYSTNNVAGVRDDGVAFIHIKGFSYQVPSWIAVGKHLYIEPLGGVIVDSVAYYASPNDNQANVFIKKPDGTNFTLAEIDGLITTGTRVYRSYYGEAVMTLDMKTPARLMVLTLGHKNYGAKVKIELLSNQSGSNDGSNPLTTETVSALGNTNIYGNAVPKVYVHTAADVNSALAVASSSVVTISSSSIIIDTGNTTMNPFVNYIIDFGEKKQGTLRLTHMGQGAATTTRPILGSQVIIFKGALLGNRDLLRNWSMGGHTLGAWLGEEASYWNETRDHVADALSYMSGALQAAIIQAPIVNEYLKQTPIATFKTRLDTLKTRLGTDNILIFSTIGQNAKEYGTDAAAIKYNDYFNAVKEWAEAKGGNVTFFNGRDFIKDYVAKNNIPTSLLFLNDAHPSALTNELLYKALEDIANLKF